MTCQGNDLCHELALQSANYRKCKKSTVHKEIRQNFGSAAVPLSRVILGLTLLLSIVWANVPSVADASGGMCELACCAGRTPHAVGSCMNGSCHAFLTGSTTKGHVHHEEPREQTEELCGLSQLKRDASRLMLLERVTMSSGFGAHSANSRGSSTSTPEKARISAAAFTKPCQLDCGTCGSGFTNSTRKRNSSALAYADHPRPPSGGARINLQYKPARKLSALGRLGAPRGPPFSFS